MALTKYMLQYFTKIMEKDLWEINFLSPSLHVWKYLYLPITLLIVQLGMRYRSFSLSILKTLPIDFSRIWYYCREAKSHPYNQSSLCILSLPSRCFTGHLFHPVSYPTFMCWALGELFQSEWVRYCNSGCFFHHLLPFFSPLFLETLLISILTTGMDSSCWRVLGRKLPILWGPQI